MVNGGDGILVQQHWQELLLLSKVEAALQNRGGATAVMAQRVVTATLTAN